MKNILQIGLAIFTLTIVLTSCSNKREPNYRYMPDMYEAIPYETYGEAGTLPNNMEAQATPEGTIARGKMPYMYANTMEGYQLAKDSLANPLANTSENLTKGKKYYNIYCAICHGKKGDGQGNLVKREKFLGVPNYKDRDITAGSAYHVIMYGRNLMGSHASQLNEEQRWQVVQYVQKLKKDLK
jgi:mono/diheme cytochrome c family protein